MTKRIALMVVVVTLMAGRAEAGFVCNDSAVSALDMTGTYSYSMQTPQGTTLTGSMAVSVYTGILSANLGVPNELASDPFYQQHWDGRMYGSEDGSSFWLVGLGQIGPGAYYEGTFSRRRGGGLILTVASIKFGWSHSGSSDGLPKTFTAQSTTGGTIHITGAPIPCLSHTPPPMSQIIGRPWEYEYDSNPIYTGTLIWQGANFNFLYGQMQQPTPDPGVTWPYDVYMFWTDYPYNAGASAYLWGWLWPRDRSTPVMVTILGYYPNSGFYTMNNGGSYGPNGLGPLAGNLFNPSTWQYLGWNWWAAGGVYP